MILAELLEVWLLLKFYSSLSPLRHTKAPHTSQQLHLLQNSLQDTSVLFVDILYYNAVPMKHNVRPCFCPSTLHIWCPDSS